MASKSGGKWVWKKRDDGPTVLNWVEQTRGHTMLSIEAVKGRMREMGCHHVAGKGGDSTFVFECPESD